MSNNLHLLRNVPMNVKQQLLDATEELTAGMKLIGYEEFDLTFDDDSNTASASFRNDSHVIVAYFQSHDTMDLKITDLTHKIPFRTKVIKSICLRDIPSVLRVII